MRMRNSLKQFKVPMKNRFHLILLILISGFYACNSDDSDECVENRRAYVTEIDAPESAQINEPVLINVNFGVSNGCGQFGKFIEQFEGNVITIEVEARYSGCMCTQDAPIRNTPYEFVTDEPGLYTLKFKSGAETFIEKDIEVTE